MQISVGVYLYINNEYVLEKQQIVVHYRETVHTLQIRDPTVRMLGASRHIAGSPGRWTENDPEVNLGKVRRPLDRG